IEIGRRWRESGGGNVARSGAQRAGPEKVTAAGNQSRRMQRWDWRRPLLPGAGPLARVHPALALVAVLAVFAAGVWWGGVGGVLVLGFLALTVSGLLAATWPRLSVPDRVLRLAVITVLVSIALQRWG
ncbi:MAG: hypothetical protein LC799_13690, partial [Actinobacteria bacterium]|nr:hypothetical protein [Actinomycetota bacterium]